VVRKSPASVSQIKLVDRLFQFQPSNQIVGYMVQSQYPIIN